MAQPTLTDMSADELEDEIEMASAQLAVATSPSHCAARLRAFADEIETMQPKGQ